MILDVIFICSGLQVAGEMLCVFSHVAVLLVCCCWVFFCFFFYGKKMSLACFYSQIDFACGCPDADEL